MTKKLGDLSQRQQCMLEFIIDFKRMHDGTSPSTREIVEHCHITSTSVVSYNLKQLERLGYIQKGEGNRSIRVTGGNWSLEDS